MHEGAWHAGVGNMPDLPQQGWLPWLKSQRKKGLQVHQHLHNASPDTDHAVLVYAAYTSTSRLHHPTVSMLCCFMQHTPAPPVCITPQ